MVLSIRPLRYKRICTEFLNFRPQKFLGDLCPSWGVEWQGAVPSSNDKILREQILLAPEIRSFEKFKWGNGPRDLRDYALKRRKKRQQLNIIPPTHLLVGRGKGKPICYPFIYCNSSVVEQFLIRWQQLVFIEQRRKICGETIHVHARDINCMKICTECVTTMESAGSKFNVSDHRPTSYHLVGELSTLCQDTTTTAVRWLSAALLTSARSIL